MIGCSHLKDQLSSMNLRSTCYQSKEEVQSVTVLTIMAQTLGEGTVTHVLKYKMKSSLLFSYVQHMRRNFAFPATSHPSPREDWFTHFLLLLRLWVRSGSCYSGFVFSFNLTLHELSDNRNKSTYYCMFKETGDWMAEEAMRRKAY